MEVSSLEGEIPMPLNSTTYGGPMTHHEPAVVPNKHNTTAHQITIPSNNGVVVHTATMEGTLPYNKKQQARYKECLKNHAAAMGGNATDGCGEFMPSGEEGSIEALTCSVCNCHRNFHRKEVQGDQHCDFYHNSPHLNRVGRRVVFGGHHKNLLGCPTTGPDAVPHQMIMSYNMGLGSLPSESDEQEDGGMVGPRPRHMQLLKKRFRTKFTQEQKEKMFNFAEKVGWKIQKQEESAVQQLCQEIGVKRRVLKVWMHNNKHNLAKNNPFTVA